jgi:beta-mannosidase
VTGLIEPGAWELATTPDGPWRPASVPGNWYLDGVDGPETVWYRTTVEVPATWGDGAIEVHVGAADYRATVLWGGVEVGDHTGGFAPFVAGAPGGAGLHELVLRVECPTDEYGTVWPHAKTTLRGVMGHHDARPGSWSERGQERSTGGVWGPVTVRPRPEWALRTVRCATEVRGADADLRIAAVVDHHGPEAAWVRLRVVLSEDGGAGAERYHLWTDTFVDPGRHTVEVTGPLAAPRLWWTWDQGVPHRYRLRTEVLVVDDGPAGDAGSGRLVASDERLVGVRTVEVGDDWVWRLNGRPVFVRGMNYIGEQWLSALDADRAAGDVALAVGANLNTLRVHAHVTVPAFYDACDAAGVMVWQDLPMQWGYADSAETYRVARRMVAELVDLHGWRPSVAHWCAHNESPWNEPWMADEAGSFVPDQNQRLDHELAELFRRLDPSRPVIANSGAGDGHTYPGWYWGTWRVASEIPGGAFVTEYGAQALPDPETLRTFLPEHPTLEDWSYHGFQHHEHSRHVGVDVFTNSVEELVAASQHYQARLLQFATEHYRRRKRERVQGVIPFMLTDPWPCISWSVVDHLRRPKPGYHALARAMQPVLPSIEAASDTYPGDDPFDPDPCVFGVWWINDTHESHPGATLEWRLVGVDGTELDRAERRVDVFADGARRVLQAGPFDLPPGAYVIESRLVDRGGRPLGENRWEFTVTEAPAWPEPVADDAAEQHPGGGREEVGS